MLDKNDILGNLNDRQSEAVETTEGHVRVVAGAGSGKTRVLAHRYAFLVNELGIDPGNILCMTFTNKAAQEMKRRISKLVHRGNVNDFVCTIHGFCVKFLREEIFRIGYPKNFIISDEEDSKMLAKQVMEEFNIGIDKTNVTNLLNSIQKFKSINIDYYINEVMDEDHMEDIVDYFKESESDDLECAIQELGSDYTEDEIRLVRIKFLSEMGN